MRTISIVRCRLFLVFPILALLMMLSCSDPESPVKDDPALDRSNPDNLVEMLAGSYKEMDLEGYEECLDEDFLFYFTPEVADGIGLPPDEAWWGKTADLNSTRQMFEDPSVEDIVFSYETVGTWVPHTEVREDTTYSGLFRRFDPLLEVVTVVEGDDPVLKYRVDDSWLDITVVPDRYTEGLWCILSIREVRKQLLQSPVPSVVSATEASTWGGIKGMWQ